MSQAILAHRGIDSSLVTAVAQSLSIQPLKTFSVGFLDPKKDESSYARRVARHLGTEHHEFRLEESQALDLLTRMPEVYDEPFADTSAVPTMYVSEMARRDVTVTLSGDGGDELFLGYGAYAWAERLANPVLWALRYPLSLLLRPGSQRWARVGELLNVPNRRSLREHIFSQEQYLFSQADASSLLLDPVSAPLLDAVLGRSRRLTPAELQAFFDFQFYLPDDLLTKVDRASMRFSLETRVPLLDNAVISFALNLHPNLRIRRGDTKYLLKKVLYKYLPEDYFRRPKRGFSIPLDRWLGKELRDLPETYLSRESVEDAGLVDWTAVREIKQAFFSGQTRLYHRVWVLTVLHQWFYQNRQQARGR